MAEAEVTPAVPAAPVTPEPTKPSVKERQFEIINMKGEKQVIGESVLIERYKKAEGLEGRVAQAAKLEEAFNSFVQRAQNPEQLLQLLEHPSLKYDEVKQEALIKSMLSSKKPNIIQAVKKWLYDNEIEPATLTPEERERRELKAYKEQQEAKNKAMDEESKTKKEQEEVQRYWNEFRVKIGSELTAQGVPQKESIVGRVARYALLYRQANREIDFKDCVSRVKADLIEEYNLIHNDATEDNILDRLPEGMAEKINKALLKRLKAKEKEKGKVEKSDSTPRSRDESSREEREKTRKYFKDLERGTIKI